MTDHHDRFSQAIEHGVRLDNDWRGLEKRIRATVPDLAAASYDREPSDPVVWCDYHERPVVDCRRRDEFCSGIPLEKRTDPTGDAAVNNRAYEDAGAFIAWAKRACHAIEQMVAIAARYKPDDPQLKLDVEEANTKPDGCEVCARSGKWVPIHVAAANPNGVLPKPLAACRWHFDFVSTYGRLPDEREEATHQAGGRVTVRAPKQMDRLRRGVQTGVL